MVAKRACKAAVDAVRVRICVLDAVSAGRRMVAGRMMDDTDENVGEGDQQEYRTAEPKHQ